MHVCLPFGAIQRIARANRGIFAAMIEDVLPRRRAAGIPVCTHVALSCLVQRSRCYAPRVLRVTVPGGFLSRNVRNVDRKETEFWLKDVTMRPARFVQTFKG